MSDAAPVDGAPVSSAGGNQSESDACPDGGAEATDAAETNVVPDHRTTVISRTVTRVVVPVIVVTAVALLLQGHNRPGGGFIGAVLTATAFVLVYVIFGLGYLQTDVLGLSPDPDERDSVVEAYRWLFAVGLVLAAGTGLVPIALGLPFLSHAVVFLEHVPLYDELEVASAFAFDLGVYFTVVGALLTVLGEVGAE